MCDEHAGGWWMDRGLVERSARTWRAAFALTDAGSSHWARLRFASASQQSHPDAVSSAAVYQHICRRGQPFASY